MNPVTSCCITFVCLVLCGFGVSPGLVLAAPPPVPRDRRYRRWFLTRMRLDSNTPKLFTWTTSGSKPC